MLSSSCARTSFSLLSLRSLTMPADSNARRRASRFLVSQRGTHEYLAYGAVREALPSCVQRLSVERSNRAGSSFHPCLNTSSRPCWGRAISGS
jgi:hypothetical protein